MRWPRRGTATAEKHPIVEALPFSVIAMGKWGARELNYSSDIDFVLVHDNVDGADTESRSAALALAGRLLTILSTPTAEGEALEVDIDLRPEGSMGPLSRTLESYARYYEQWGEAWELQALLKARPAAGDLPLGARFIALTEQRDLGSRSRCRVLAQHPTDQGAGGAGRQLDRHQEVPGWDPGHRVLDPAPATGARATRCRSEGAGHPGRAGRTGIARLHRARGPSGV